MIFVCFPSLQSRDPSSKMTTEFFALPGLHHASPSNNDVSAKVFDDDRDSRQMCTSDSWGSSSCVDEESDLSFGSQILIISFETPDIMTFG